MKTSGKRRLQARSTLSRIGLRMLKMRTERDQASTGGMFRCYTGLHAYHWIGVLFPYYRDSLAILPTLGVYWRIIPLLHGSPAPHWIGVAPLLQGLLRPRSIERSIKRRAVTMHCAMNLGRRNEERRTNTNINIFINIYILLFFYSMKRNLKNSVK